MEMVVGYAGSALVRPTMPRGHARCRPARIEGIVAQSKTPWAVPSQALSGPTRMLLLAGPPNYYFFKF